MEMQRPAVWDYRPRFVEDRLEGVWAVLFGFRGFVFVFPAAAGARFEPNTRRTVAWPARVRPQKIKTANRAITATAAACSSVNASLP
jgi:hypothetical protein